MSELRPELAAALGVLYPGSRHETLPGDASSRRFHRLVLAGGGTRVVMDYGASFEGETDDVRLARIFERATLPVARVIDVLPSAGALVEEDLGDETLESAMARYRSRGRSAGSDLYRSAVVLAAGIATRGSESLARSERASGPSLDEERFRFEMRFFLEHYVGTFLGRPDVGSDVREALDALATATASHPRVLCHRDYHSRNIMVRADGALALVDIQDARWGPDTYDLASLLRDAYADLTEDAVEELFEVYRQQLPRPIEGTELRSRFELTSAQRTIKALGTFGYQVAVLGRQRYRSAIPRAVERLSRLLPANTQTASLAEVLLSAGLLSG
jgi:hypothetical protein